MLLVPVYTKVQSPLNWEVPGCCHLLGWALWQKYFWAEYILWRLSIICSRQKKLNEMWMSRNVFNNNWLLLVSEHRKCFVGNFGGSNDWAQVDRWQPLNGIFFLLPMKYFSRVILGNHQSSDLWTLSLPHSTNIWSSQMFRESQHMRQFKQFFVTLLLKIVVFLSAGYFFITLEFCVRVTLW